MEYIQSFPDTDGDGLPDIPEKYRGRLGKIVMEPNWHPLSLLSKGTWVTWTAFSAGFVVCTVSAFIVIFVRRKLKRTRGNSFSPGWK